MRYITIGDNIMKEQQIAKMQESIIELRCLQSEASDQYKRAVIQRAIDKAYQVLDKLQSS